jgi:hypothetical protein
VNDHREDEAGCHEPEDLPAMRDELKFLPKPCPIGLRESAFGNAPFFIQACEPPIAERYALCFSAGSPCSKEFLMLVFSPFAKKSSLVVVLLSAAVSSRAVAGTIFATGVVSSSGLGDSTANAWNDPTSALGMPTTSEEFGAVNPFNPPFETNDMVVIPAGGTVELSFSQPAAITSAPSLGVFVNNGLADVSSDGSGVAGTPASYFSAIPEATVSISQDGNIWHAVGDETFSLPTNAYLDTEISGYFQPAGNVLADFGKPFTGTLSQLDGLDYDQIRALFNGSAGGNWLNLAGTGLSSFQYVEFSVPAGSSERMVIDGISAQAVPEPVSIALLIPAAIVATGRRRRVA